MDANSLLANHGCGKVRIYFISVAYLLQVGSPSRAIPTGTGATDMCPVYKVLRVPDEKTWLIIIS